MTVSELLEELKHCDPDAYVVWFNTRECFYEEPTHLTEHKVFKAFYESEWYNGKHVVELESKEP